MINFTGAKILVSPWCTFYNSRLRSISKLGDFLADNGHDVSIIVPSFLQEHVSSSKMEVIAFEVGNPMETGIHCSYSLAPLVNQTVEKSYLTS